MHCRSTFFARGENLAFQKIIVRASFWMNDVENYQKANQNLFHMDAVLYLIELFLKLRIVSYFACLI